MEQRWNPWAELRRRPWVTLEFADLDGVRGLWIPRWPAGTLIVLDWRLTRRERRCTLAHELVHDERGIAYTADHPDGLVDVEERAVWAETVRRLVPPAQLVTLVDVADGEPVEVHHVEELFDVDRNVAERACRSLLLAE
jgi:hypothetical protein